MDLETFISTRMDAKLTRTLIDQNRHAIAMRVNLT